MPTETIKALDGALALAFVVAAIAGASGACLVAAHRALRGRSITLLLFLSYAIVGAVLSVAMIAYMSAFLGAQLTFAELIFYAIVAGSAGSATLAATNLSARFILRRLGIEVTVQVRQTEKENSS